MWKRIAAGVLGLLAIISGVPGCGYATTAVGDFLTGNSVWIALSGMLVLWLLTLGAFWMGADFLKFAVSGKPFRLRPRLRAAILGVLSFFPGFIFTLPFAFTYVSHWQPNDEDAPIRAVLVCASAGVVFAMLISMFLVRRAIVRTNSANGQAGSRF